MTTQMTIEFTEPQSAQTLLRALELYKARLRANIERTRRHLTDFEKRYSRTTADFLSTATAEDLPGGDMEYILWAGEAKLLAGLEQELAGLEHAHYHLP